MLTEYPRLGEKLDRRQLSNGLTVLVVPRPGFTRKSAYFVTDYGSVHTDFVLEGRAVHAPAGIAHFLEHKMFELEGRDVTAEFAALGAHVNAFTSYDVTAYYASCTENFSACLRLLLEFVATPWFPAESVEREMGIIDQEIGMNADSPDTRVFENLMGAMYHQFPIYTPILGTSDTIRQITPQLLTDCHRAFYTPANMVLCVVGDVDPEEVSRIALEVLGPQARPAGQKLPFGDEPAGCVSAEVTDTMEIAMTTFLLGFKCGFQGTGEEAVRRELIADLACELLFGESSPLYLQLYGEGLIDGSFGGGFEVAEREGMVICGGDSRDPRQIRRRILEQARILCAEGIEKADFLRLKRSILGRRIRDLDSFDPTCFRLCAYHLDNFDYFRFPEICEQVTEEEILAFVNDTIRENRCAISLVDPIHKEASQ